MPVKINGAELDNIQVNGANVEKVGVAGRPVFLLVGSGEYKRYGFGNIPNEFTFNTSQYGGVDEFRVLMKVFSSLPESGSFAYVVNVRVAMNGVPNLRTFEISITGSSTSETHINFHMLNDQYEKDTEDVIWVGSFSTTSNKEILDIKVNNEGNNLLVSFIGGYKTIELYPSSENTPDVTWYNKDYPVFYVSGSTTTARGYGFQVNGEGVKTARTV